MHTLPIYLIVFFHYISVQLYTDNRLFDTAADWSAACITNKQTYWNNMFMYTNVPKTLKKMSRDDELTVRFMRFAMSRTWRSDEGWRHGDALCKHTSSHNDRYTVIALTGIWVIVCELAAVLNRHHNDGDRTHWIWYHDQMRHLWIWWQQKKHKTRWPVNRMISLNVHCTPRTLEGNYPQRKI